MAVSPKVASKAPAGPRAKKPVRRSIGRPVAKGGVGRESLIETTCELLKTLPPNEVTRVGVARKANVDPSLIKYYFRDRSSLLLAAAERLMDQAAVAMERASAEAGNTAEGRLRARISGLLDLNLNYPFFHRLIMDEVVNSKDALAQQLLSSMTDRRMGVYGEIIEMGVQAGALRRVEPFFLSTAVIGMCEFFATGSAMMRAALGEGVDESRAREGYKEFIIDLIMNGLKSDGGGPKAKPDKGKPKAKSAAKDGGSKAKVKVARRG